MLCGGFFFADLNVSPYLTPSTRPLTSRFYPNITTRQAELKPPARNSELSQGVLGLEDKKSGELVMSGRWRRLESPPHSPPTTELWLGDASHP